MNKRFLQLLWAIPLLGVLSGCSESELGTPSDSRAIRVSSDASRLTRAVVTDNDNITGAHFGLYAYTTSSKWVAGTTKPSSASGAEIKPDVMDDYDIHYDNTAWTYSPTQYWPNNGDLISFFGYWPKTDGVTDASIPSDTELPVIKFTQKVDNPTDMVDFLAAHELNRDRSQGPVVMDFKHTLTRLNFQACLDTDLSAGGESSNTGVFVKGMKLLGKDVNTASKFYQEASYQLADGGTGDVTNGAWKYEAAVQAPTTLDINDIMNFPTANPGVGTYTTTAPAVSVNSNGSTTDLLKTGEYLFLIPPSANGIENKTDIMMEVTYDIVTVNGAQTRVIPRKETISLYRAQNEAYKRG